MRAISTVLDVTLCLLLVSASVLTLAGTPSDTADEDPRYAADAADETAETLATSTARVTYRAENRSRTTHDTLAGLLVSAARADARPDAANSTSAFVGAVTQTVGHALRRAEVGVQVVAHPVDENGTQHSRVTAGQTPPPDADVHAAGFVLRRVRLTVRTWDR